MMRLFDIQHYCVHDGPGIRTTVFLKGCPLRCGWCHNPESAILGRQMMFYPDKCVSCGACVPVCPQGAQIMEQGVHRFRREKCHACGLCVRSCAQRALEISGCEQNLMDIYEEICRDRMFYGDDGGVTFSGGEPLLQHEPLLALLELCRQGGIHNAVETSLYAPQETVAAVAERTDLMICDYKIADPALHKKYTGVGNEQILKNMEMLLKCRAQTMWVRTPVIPGVNDTEENMREMGAFLSGYPLARVELLPYHDMGESKYMALGKVYEFSGEQTPTSENMEKLRCILRECGVAQVC